MSRITLAIADLDEQYLESLTGFLVSEYPHRFHVNTFSQINGLKAFFAMGGKKADIFLAAPSILSEIDIKECACTVVLLSDNRACGEFDGMHAVYKYQHADELISAVMRIYSDESGERGTYPGSNKKTVAVALYSPSGGSGKTSVALGLSALCTMEGLQSFYLNLEDIPSSGCFSDESPKYNFSNVIFELKDPKPNFSLKMEASRCIHKQFGIHYFPPADSVREVNKLNSPEISFLIRQLKALGQYDAIFADMSCGLNEVNIALLEACDEIIVLLDCHETSVHKAFVFANELKIIFGKDFPDITEKITPVINKYSGMALPETESLFGKPPAARLPHIYELNTLNNIWTAMLNNREFANGLDRVLKACGIL